MMTEYLNNPQLTTIKPEYLGNEIRDGKFRNYQASTPPHWKQILRWQFSYRPQKTLNRYSRYHVPLIEDPQLFCNNVPKISWLGHASFLLTLNGKNIIIDPIFGKIPLVKRRAKIPFSPEEYQPIDYILISHAHYDHLDKKTLCKLTQLNPHAKVYCGLATAELLRSWKIANQIVEAGWYQQFPIADDEIKFYFMPAQHWSNRTLKDRNIRLWGSFIIQSQAKTIYFMGDSAYGGHFQEIGQFFPTIDYALIGIGAYTPRYIMQSSHLNPEEAYQAYLDLGARHLIPMHYATFILSDEPLREPIEKTRQLFDAPNQRLRELAIGEVLVLN
jgi:L-ascorbate metabolism protein UlaG (beta-lactamase superfamily)